ncbi:MAG: arylsulfatase [Chloroflexota bacterium]|nr:arylsulfatase [Chloroflexota bacterium]
MTETQPGTGPRTAGAGARPNVILIMADDMGYSDIGCFGSEIATPNLDSLATGGMRLSQFYNYARCCPTRASLLTGLYPHEAGIGHMIINLGTAPYQGYLNRNCLTLAEALKPAGYSAYMAGKWHVGGDYPFRTWRQEMRMGEPDHPTPRQRGFDRYFGILTGGSSFFDPHTLLRDDELCEIDYPNFYLTDAIAEESAKYVREHVGDDPYLLYVAFTAPHFPLHAPAEDVERYRGRYRIGWDELRRRRHEELNGMGILSETWDISPRDPEAPAWEDVPDQDWEDSRMAVYAAMVDRMDQGIGKILDAVRASGQWDNTLIIFLSDNGGSAEFLSEDGVADQHPRRTRDGRPIEIGNEIGRIPGPETTCLSYDLPWSNASCTPFRFYKHYVHEGGISTPFIAHWPAVIEPGSIDHQPAWVGDFMPTFLEAAGASYPREHGGEEIKPLRGESFLPALSGKSIGRQRSIFFEHESNRAVRDGNWKLVSRHPGNWELFDMDADRTELQDLAAANPRQVDVMAAAHAEWSRELGVREWEELISMPQAGRLRSWQEDDKERLRRAAESRPD